MSETENVRSQSGEWSPELAVFADKIRQVPGGPADGGSGWLDRSLETLAGLRPAPAGAGAAVGAGFDPNLLFLLVSAWAPIDPNVAADLVAAALDRQATDGLAPAADVNDADGLVLSAWPLFAQSALRTLRAGADRRRIATLMPALHRYLVRTIVHFEPDGDGYCRWHAASEALVPELFDEHVIGAVDLTTWMICEIESFMRLAVILGHRGFDRTVPDGALRRIALKLEQQLWNPADRCFSDRYDTGAFVQRVSLHSIMPLWWSRLPGEYAAPLQQMLGVEGPFTVETGFPAWVRWADDPADPPVRCVHQFVVLELMRRGGLFTAESRLTARLRAALDACFRAEGGLPERLDRPAENAAIAPAAAALAVLVSAGELRVEEVAQRPLPPVVRWLDAHRGGVTGGVIGLLALVILGITLGYQNRKIMPPASTRALADLGLQHYAKSNYVEAVQLFEEVYEGSGGSQQAELLLANALLAGGNLTEAEQHYRHIVESQHPLPQARLNLALTLYRAGRLAEASECYREFIKLYADRYPRMSARARDALRLVEERMEINRMAQAGAANR